MRGDQKESLKTSPAVSSFFISANQDTYSRTRTAGIISRPAEIISRTDGHVQPDCKSGCLQYRQIANLPERMRNLPKRNGKLRNIVLDGAGQNNFP